MKLKTLRATSVYDRFANDKPDVEGGKDSGGPNIVENSIKMEKLWTGPATETQI